MLTWILLGSSGNSTNSDELGSSDAAAFTVSTIVLSVRRQKVGSLTDIDCLRD